MDEARTCARDAAMIAGAHDCAQRAERERCARVCLSVLDAYGARSDAGAHLICGVLREVLAGIRASEEWKHPFMANADEVRELRERIDGFEDLVLNLRDRVHALEEEVSHLFGWDGAGR